MVQRTVVKELLSINYLKIKRLDILFIQETHSTLDNDRDWKKEWSGDVFLSHKSFNSGGVGILFSNNFKPVSYKEEVVVEGRLLKVKAQYEDVKMFFIHIYAPTKGTDRLLFLDTLGEVISQCDIEETVHLSSHKRQCSISFLLTARGSA